MRARVEAQLGLIASGAAEHGEVVAHAVDTFAAKFKYFVAHIERMHALFDGHFSTLEESKGRNLSYCGVCRHTMKYIGARPPRLHCLTCDVTYKLPADGHIKLYMNHACPLDGFELLAFSTGGPNGVTYPLCPACFNNPPSFHRRGDAGETVTAAGAGGGGGSGGDSAAPVADVEDAGSAVASAMGCNRCQHPTCKFSVASTGVTECPEAGTCGGTLVFEPTTGPNWCAV